MIFLLKIIPRPCAVSTIHSDNIQLNREDINYSNIHNKSPVQEETATRTAFKRQQMKH